MSEQRRLKLVLSYDGAPYHGWQVQPNGPSIQSVLAEAIEKITSQHCHPVGSGRTDSGVHALGQVAHFDTDSPLPVANMLRALNFHLPPTIVVREVTEVPTTFHASKSARSKHYRYVFQDGPLPDVFTRGFAWWAKYQLDARLMAQAAGEIIGTHDFRSFETEWPNRRSSIRTVTRAEISRLGDHVLFDVESNGFLYNMVRALAGTLFQIGRGKWEVGQMKEILEAGDRTLAGPTAPAHGLFLIKVHYDD